MAFSAAAGLACPRGGLLHALAQPVVSGRADRREKIVLAGEMIVGRGMADLGLAGHLAEGEIPGLSFVE